MSLKTFLDRRLECQYHITGREMQFNDNIYYQRIMHEIYNEILKQLCALVEPEYTTILRGRPAELPDLITHRYLNLEYEFVYDSLIITPAMYYLNNDILYEQYITRPFPPPEGMPMEIQICKLPDIEYAALFYRSSDLHVYIHGFGNNRFKIRVLTMGYNLSLIIYYDDMCPFCMHIARDSMVGSFKLNYPVEIEIQTESEFKLLL